MKRTKRGFVRRLLRWAAMALVAFYTLAASALLYLRFFRPLTTTVHVQRRIEALIGGKPYGKQYEWRPLREISKDLQHAVIAAEDARFYEHWGIDWKAVRDIAEEGVERGHVRRGGSTITQQLVKNLFLTTHRNPVRKAVEVMLTPAAELILPKQRILELYLNVIE